MKFSIVAASLLSTFAVASPTIVDDLVSTAGRWGHWGGGGGGWGGSGKPYFTSTYRIDAVPGQVVNATPDSSGFFYTGGLPGCSGLYEYGLNSKTETICWSIKLWNFRGKYQSLAKTATHIHQGDRGKTGPPRIAFPNPKRTGKGYRLSEGCMQAPFTTGVLSNGVDTGSASGFKLAQIEANPRGFFTDVHSSLAVPGAVRGQFPRG